MSARPSYEDPSDRAAIDRFAARLDALIRRAEQGAPTHPSDADRGGRSVAELETKEGIGSTLDERLRQIEALLSDGAPSRVGSQLDRLIAARLEVLDDELRTLFAARLRRVASGRSPLRPADAPPSGDDGPEDM